MAKTLKGQKIVRMGLGDAVRKTNNLQALINSGVGTERQKSEYRLIMNALNEIQIDVGFDCDGDGIPDNIEIFQQTAETECCRLMEVDTSRRAVNAVSTSRRKTKTSSRRK